MTTYGELFDKQDNESKQDAIVEMLAQRHHMIDDIMEDVAKYDAHEREMGEYLSLLTTRFEPSSRPMNHVRKVTGLEHDMYFVDNYSYTMYKWFIRREFDTAFLTPFALGVREDKLTKKEKESFDAKLG